MVALLNIFWSKQSPALKTFVCLLVLVGIITAPAKAEFFQPEDAPLYLTEEPKTIYGLPLRLEGLSLTAGVGVEQELFQNLNSIHLYSLIPPTLDERKPNSICHEYACGQEKALQYHADLILAGTLKVDGNHFSLNISLSKAVNGQVVFQQDFGGNSGWAPIFQAFVNKLRDQTEVVGHVVAIENSKITISIGSNHGIQTQDKLVIFKPEIHDASVYYDKDQLLQKATGLLRVEQIAMDKASGILYYSYGQPSIGDKVVWIKDVNRQRFLVNQAQWQMDGLYRNAGPTTPYVSGLPKEQEATGTIRIHRTPIYDLAERDRWILRVRYYEKQRELFKWVAIGGAAVATGLYFTKNVPSIGLFGAVGVGAYGLYEFVDARRNFNQLIDEGKYKGYLDYQWLSQSEPSPNQPNWAWHEVGAQGGQSNGTQTKTWANRANNYQVILPLWQAEF